MSQDKKKTPHRTSSGVCISEKGTTEKSHTRTKYSMCLENNHTRKTSFRSDHIAHTACYSVPVAPHWATGFSSLNAQAGSRDISDMRFFYARNPSCSRIMAGRDGEASAPAGFLCASLLTPSRLATPFSSVVVRLLKIAQGAFHMATSSRNSQYVWRFLALNRHDRKAKPCRLSVEAATEREARRILSPHFILSLAARLPVAEVRHA